MCSKIKHFEGEEQRNASFSDEKYNISQKEILYQSNNEHTPSKRALPFYSIFYLPEHAPDLLEAISQYTGILNEDGTLTRNVSIVAMYRVFVAQTVIYKNVSSRQFQKVVYKHFNTEFKEQKHRPWGSARNADSYGAYKDMIEFFLSRTDKGQVLRKQ